MENSQIIKNNFFYFNSRGKYCIADLELISKSDRTIDVKLFDIANNEKLLKILNLYYLHSGFGSTYTYQSRGEWFCCYLSSFNTWNEVPQNEKSLTNPTVRILVEDQTIMSDIIDCLKFVYV